MYKYPSICTNILAYFRVKWRILFIYYSFKIFPRFGLVETTRIIHHNQLLFTKFGKNLRHIQSMTSKVEPAAYYSTVDVKMTSKVETAADYSTVDRKNLGTRLWFWWAEKQRAKRRNSIKNGEIFWIWRIFGYEEFCRSRRVLSTEAEGRGG